MRDLREPNAPVVPLPEGWHVVRREYPGDPLRARTTYERVEDELRVTVADSEVAGVVTRQVTASLPNGQHLRPRHVQIVRRFFLDARANLRVESSAGVDRFWQQLGGDGASRLN